MIWLNIKNGYKRKVIYGQFPNILGYFRLALIPVFAWIYMHADTAAENFAAACVIGVVRADGYV